MVWDNECLANQKYSSLQPPTPDAPATFLPYCAEWVINTTDKVWLPTRTPKQVTEALQSQTWFREYDVVKIFCTFVGQAMSRIGGCRFHNKHEEGTICLWRGRRP